MGLLITLPVQKTSIALCLSSSLLIAFLIQVSLVRNVYATPTLLSANDVVIVSANSDTAYSASACVASPESNAVDLLLRVPIGSGTVIKVTDNGWTGSALSTTEGVLTYTAATDLPAGTIIRYTDCLVQNASNGWTRTGGFDPATGGDGLLVYQGADTNPSFIYGFGFRTTSWISTGTITTATSYVPASLASASVPAYATGTAARDYQYTTAGNYGIYSSTFLTDLRTMANWQTSGNTTTPGIQYTQTTVPFDSTRPTFNTATRSVPTASTTNASTLVFQITTSEPVQALSASAFTVVSTGTLAYTNVVASQVSASTYTVTVNGVTGSGTIKVGSFADPTLLDVHGNPADNTTVSSEVYTVDRDLPTIVITAPTKLKKSSITDTAIQVTDNTGIAAGSVTIASAGSTAGTSGFSCSQTSATQVDCIVTITSSGDLNIQAIDTFGNIATKKELGYVIDTLAPTFSMTSVDVTTHSVDQPIVSFAAVDNIAIDHYEVLYIADNAGAGVSSSATAINPATSPLTLTLDHDETVHTITIRAYDTAGNYTDHVIKFPPIVNFTAPTTLSNSTIANSTVTITSPMGNDLTDIVLDAGTTGASLGVCTDAGGNTTDPYASPVTCTINSISNTGSITIQATDSGIGAVGRNSQGYTIDTTAPIITIGAPTKLNNSSITNTTVTVTDNVGVLAGSVAIDGGSTTAVTSNFSCTQTSVIRVDCTIQIDTSGDIAIVATDNAGTAIAKVEGGYSIDTISPVVSVGMLPPITAGNQDAYGISGTCTNGDGAVTISINGVSYATSCTSGVWTITVDLSNLPEGVNVASVTASQTDAAGNVGLSTVKSTDKDSIPPSATFSSLSTYITSPALTGSINDPLATVSVTINGHIYAASNSGDGIWTLPAGVIVPTLSVDTYAATLVVRDVVGNQSSYTALVIIQRSDADTPTVEPVDWIGGTPIITGHYDAANSQSLSVAVNGVTYALGVAPELSVNGSIWTLNLSHLSTALSIGSYSVTASVTTRDGRTLEDSTSKELKIIAQNISSVIANPGAYTTLANTGVSMWVIEIAGVIAISAGVGTIATRKFRG